MGASTALESRVHLAPGIPPSFSGLYGAPIVEKQSNAFPDRYLDPPLRQDLRYHPSTSDGFWGRAGDAASRLLISRDGSGKRKFNTSYLLATLASAAVANTAYRRYRTQLVPYQAQSVSGTFSSFGSAVGGDAGKRIFQQFWPNIRQILRGHALKVLQ
jgi:hypothetical protein